MTLASLRVLSAASLFVLAAASASLAVPTEVAPSPAPRANLTLVYGGCGPYGHRGPYGHCRAGGQAGGYVPGHACPWGWHLGPYGHHCFRN